MFLIFIFFYLICSLQFAQLDIRYIFLAVSHLRLVGRELPSNSVLFRGTIHLLKGSNDECGIFNEI